MVGEEEHRESDKWWGAVTAADGYVYAMPNRISTGSVLSIAPTDTYRLRQMLGDLAEGDVRRAGAPRFEVWRDGHETDDG